VPHARRSRIAELTSNRPQGFGGAETGRPGGRVGHREGLGLGLSIVAAIAAAHDATLDVRAGRHGGLEIEVRFPPAPGTPEADTPSAPQSPALTHA
jgi:hypothetical protein